MQDRPAKIRDKNSWPAWPQHHEAMTEELQKVLQSRRWTIRGWWSGSEARDSEFTRLFAEYHNVPYCVTVNSGSAGLQLALEALDIGYGDRVLIPGLTWVAVANAVLNVNAIPVFVDVDPATGCISPGCIAAAVTPGVKAVIVVHQHCRMADLDAICEIAARYNLKIIEDCSQAHGAMWGNARAGATGDVGVFSMNQEKTLTCGEGGAVITRDINIYNNLEQIRADGCLYAADKQVLYELCHEETAAGMMGGSYCLSEFQAAILIVQLRNLEWQNAKREENALYLDKQLGALGLEPVSRYAKNIKAGYYEYIIRYNPDAFYKLPLKDLCLNLEQQLGFAVHQTDTPLNRNPLYKPFSKKRFQLGAAYQAAIDNRDVVLPSCELLYDQLLVFHHRILLGSKKDMDDIVEAFVRIRKHRERV